jgi:hypothetical protein
MAINQKGFTYDQSLLLKDAGAVTATGVGQVAAANRILDLGQGRADFRVVFDVAAISAGTADQSYRLRVQLSTSPTFASGTITQDTVELGHASQTGSSANTAAPFRAEAAGSNEVNGVTYRYMRVQHVIAGTSPSINYTAYAVRATG